jgi:hypothetical protein
MLGARNLETPIVNLNLFRHENKGLVSPKMVMLQLMRADCRPHRDHILSLL